MKVDEKDYELLILDVHLKMQSMECKLANVGAEKYMLFRRLQDVELEFLDATRDLMSTIAVCENNSMLRIQSGLRDLKTIIDNLSEDVDIKDYVRRERS